MGRPSEIKRRFKMLFHRDQLSPDREDESVSISICDDSNKLITA